MGGWWNVTNNSWVSVFVPVGDGPAILFLVHVQRWRTSGVPRVNR